MEQDALNRAVTDAIVLERAARVLRRRYDLRDLTVPERIRFTVYTLESQAQSLRGDSHGI